MNTNTRKRNGYDFAKAEAWAWIGDKSYIDNKSPSLSHMIFDTKKEATLVGWKRPQRVKVLLMEPHYD